ncbi:MAG: hypothetical protein FWC20_01840 [Oscillospiraceae bacterium]|nr:hypothetical protein [Oscillospiraceae bacterium]MCL2278134.1 hypothetical protein [Oscillospiraceae bacterium]
MSRLLKQIRLESGKKMMDVVEAVKPICPAFDKAMLSKCENGYKYGIKIDPKIMNAIIEFCAPDNIDEVKRRVRGGNKMPHRVSCRLERSVYTKLQQRMKVQGFTTMQDLLMHLINNYLKGESEQ